MDPVVSKIILKRFKSIPGQAVLLDNPTFLVGQNGSGKSNFADAFSFLAEAMIFPLQAVFDKKGGIGAVRNRRNSMSAPPNIGLAVELGRLNGGIKNARYAFEVAALKNYGFEVVREQCSVNRTGGECHWFDRRKSKFHTNAKGLDPSLDPASLGLPVIGGDVRFSPVLKMLSSMRVYSLEPAKLREMQEPDSGQSLLSDGANAASVLDEIKRQSDDDYKRVCEILETVVPQTTNVRAIKHGKKLSLEFTQSWGKKKTLKFEAFSMSDGTLRALGLLVAVFQKPSPSLIVIEEPESTIHPGALGCILDILKHATKIMQVIVTTHSPDVLDAKWIHDNHIRIVQWNEGETHIVDLAAAPRKALQDHLMGAGELLRSNALDPQPIFKDVSKSQIELFDQLDA